MVSSFLIKQIISSESRCVKNLARRKIHHKTNNQTVESREERVVVTIHQIRSDLTVVVVAGDGHRGPRGRGDLSLRHHHE